MFVNALYNCVKTIYIYGFDLFIRMYGLIFVIQVRCDFLEVGT